MGTFSVALSGWALSAVASMVVGASPGASFTPASDGISMESPTETVAGFRMEGSPEIDVVFGDSRRYIAHIDRFYALHDRMEQSRAVFGRSVKASLALASGSRRCPVEQVAPHYYQAKVAGDRFRDDGAALETEYVAVRTLDKLGETAGLTPDYRWKVNRARAVYRQALVDYKEMRVSFIDQLNAELSARRCPLDRLLALGAKATPPPAPKAEPTDGAGKRKPDRDPVVPADTVTFFVDNRACSGPVEVYVDGTLLGGTDAGTKAAFQALAGRHMICLIETDSSAQCGDPGTVRTAFVFDGWTVTLHCQ